MGCQHSSTGVEEDADAGKELADFLNPNEGPILTHTWDIVKDIPGTGIYMFTRLFELQGDFKRFFRRLMTQQESGVYDFDWNKLGNHASTVMNALDSAVHSMGDSSQLSQTLIALGERHNGFNVKPEMVPFMWPAVRDALKQSLGQEFTMEAELAWKHVFDYIISKMSIGIRRARLAKTKGTTGSGSRLLRSSGKPGAKVAASEMTLNGQRS